MGPNLPNFSDVSLVLAPHGDLGDVSHWLTQLARDPELSSAPVTIIGPSPMTLDDITPPRPGPTVQLVNTSSPRAEEVLSLLTQLSTPYVAALSATRPRGDAVRRLKDRLVRGRRLWDGARPTALPRLLPTGSTPLTILGPYLSELEREGSDALSPYLARLALETGRVTLEGADPAGASLDLVIRVDLGPTSFTEPPRWQFAVGLTGAQGDVAPGDAVMLSPRVDRYGTSRFEQLRARLPLVGLASGGYRLTLATLGKSASPEGPPRDVRPSNGTLLSSRPVLLGRGDQATRYLISADGKARATQLTIQAGEGRRAALAWRRRLLARDVRFVLRGRAPGRVRALRLLRLVTVPLFWGKEIWLVGERHGTAQDNGFHFFRYLRTGHPRRHCYYVIDSDSPHAERVRPLGRVLPHSSWRHRLLMLHAAVLADAYSLHYLIPKQWTAADYTRHLAWRVGALRVYLKHGVHLSPHALNRGPTGYDVLLTVNERESAALRATSGYSHQVVEVGLPRYDALSPTPSSRTVLFMTTWRRYLVPKPFSRERSTDRPFLGSPYERFIMGLLTEPRLHEILEEHDYRLKFLPHHNVAEYFQSVTTTSSRISIATTDHTAFQDLLRECDGFITDYSSVQFDLAFLGTPMIYTHFDRNEYDGEHAAPSWFDTERDGFGPVTHTKDELLDELERMLARGCTPDPAYAARITGAFTHHDQLNSHRALAAIDARLRAGRPRRRPR